MSRKPNNQRQRPSPTRRQLIFERDGFRCVQCGARDDLTIDHIIPASRGGTQAIANLQTLCRDCNDRKADS